MNRPAPELLTETERKELLADAERLWRNLQKNDLGGYSDNNRPFYIKWKFEEVIERYGKRDVGLNWSPQELTAALAKQSTPTETETLYRWRGPRGGYLYDTNKPDWPCERLSVRVVAEVDDNGNTGWQIP